MAVPVVVFHPGTQHSWQTATALDQLDRLAFYATSIFYQPDRWPYRIERYLPELLRSRAHAEFRRFSHPALDAGKVRTAGLAEWAERLAYRAGLRRLANRIDIYGNRRFAAALASDIGSTQSFGLWGFSSSSLVAFRAAKAAGRFRILDRTIGDWRAYNALMEAVHQDYGDFFPAGDYRIPQDQIDRDDEEYSLADVILAGSPFAADTVRRHAVDRDAAGRVRVLNYCYDETLFGVLPPPVLRAHHEPLRFLFIGQAGPRKGIHLVLKALAKLPPSAARLTIVGDMQVPPAVFGRFADRVDYLPTVARADIPALMTQADILLFPSYFEGSALSLIEGLAAGLGIIQSRNAGVGVTPETGLCLDSLSEESLLEAMTTAIEDRPRVDAWRRAAQHEAARYGFATYRAAIAGLLREIDSSEIIRPA